MKINRYCAGYYRAHDGDLELTIERRDDLDGWLVSALWDAHMYSDPIPTYKMAKIVAQDIINNVRSAA